MIAQCTRIAYVVWRGLRLLTNSELEILVSGMITSTKN